MSVNNQVKLIGRLTADPKVEYYKDKCKCSFDIAVNEGKDKPAMYVPCVAWGELAEDLGNRCQKGTKVEITEGSLSIRPYTGKDGVKRKWTSVNIWKANIATKNGMSEAGFEGFGETLDKDEEIPF